MTRRHTENLQAYKAYLTGRHHWSLLLPGAMETGFKYYQKAVEHDPEFALPWAGMAEYYTLMSWMGARPPHEAMPLAKAAALKALELDNNLAQAYCALGLCQLTWDYDWAGAERSFQQADERNPEDGDNRYWHISLLIAQSRFAEATAISTRSLQSDPLSPLSHGMHAMGHYYARHYEQAVASCQQALAISANHLSAHLLLGLSYAALKRYDEAISVLDQAATASGRAAALVSALGMACAQSGEHDRARALLQELVGQRFIQSAYVAMIHTALGETDQAFEWLHRAYDERQGFLVILNVEPAFDPLRSDPRLAELLQRMGLVSAI